MENISKFFQELNNLFFKMGWLSNGMKKIVETVFGLSIDSKIGGSLHFFLYDVVKIFILLIVLIFSISYIQSYFPPERSKKILGKFSGIKGNIIGALLGTVTPFCSCSSIPLFIGFTSAGLPLGTTFSFLISSPMVDIASFLLLVSFFGLKIAIAYVVIGLILAIVGGQLIEKMNMEKYIEPFVYGANQVDIASDIITQKDRFIFSVDQVKDIVRRVWLYILIGVGIGAGIHNWIPQSAIELVLGQNNPFSVLIATLVGVPIYADIFGTIPIAEALLLKGVGIGTVLSFMMAVTTLSLPSLVMLSKVVKPKLLGTFIAIVTIGILIIGYVFNWVSFIFI